MDSLKYHFYLHLQTGLSDPQSLLLVSLSGILAQNKPEVVV